MNAKVMTTTMLPLALLSLLMIGQVSASAASKGLPDPDDPTIDVPGSLGGIRIGDDLQASNRSWGGVGRCDDGVCFYGNYESTRGVARIARKGGRVTLVLIASGIRKSPDGESGDEVYDGPLLKFRTTKGDIGLGSDMSEVRQAYPRAEKLPDRTPGRVLGVEGRGRQVMTFANHRSDTGRITEIALGLRDQR